ncbi:MAG: carboxypeptidase-like regulatory domain-containing protein [Planctomycetaceae bacterium]|nr:carboxypeptidase-like regulatory domain-containing protein [Planctomycetaceae bacterium]
MRTHLTWMLVAILVAAPQTTMAVEQTERVSLSNIELTTAGTLQGLLVTADGRPIAGESVRIHAQSDLKSVQHQVTTDRNGRFQVSGLRTGTLVVSVQDKSYACRVWSAGIAPPNAVKTAAFVTGERVVRGQDGRRFGIMDRIYSLSTRQKVCLGLIVAAAVAIPIALDDDNDNAS